MRKRILLLMATVIITLSLQATSHVDINVVLTIGQKYEGKNAVPQEPTTSTNNSVARWWVEANGDINIIGLSRGTQIIKVTTAGKETYYHVHVIDVVSITIPRFISLSEGGSYKFSPIFHDTGVTVPLTWLSADENVVTVAEDGTVSAVGEGKAVVICSTDNGITAQCLIEVQKNKSNSRAACDTNGDGDVNSADIVTVVNAIMEPEQE